MVRTTSAWPSCWLATACRLLIVLPAKTSAVALTWPQPLLWALARCVFRTTATKTNSPMSRARLTSLLWAMGLSKRTSVYGTYAYIKNKDGANLYNLGSGGLKTNGSQQGVQVGVSHAF